MANHPVLNSALAGVAVSTGIALIAHSRINYWKRWGLRLFEQFDAKVCDMLNVEPDLDELTT